MSDLAQRREAALEFHRIEYERLHPPRHPTQDLPSPSLRSPAGGLDEIDSGVRLEGFVSLPEVDLRRDWGIVLENGNVCAGSERRASLAENCSRDDGYMLGWSTL